MMHAHNNKRKIVMIMAVAASLFLLSKASGQLPWIAVRLNAGWNLISSPTTLMQLENIQNCELLVAYWYNGTEYKKVKFLEPMKGYWAFAKSDCLARFSSGRGDSEISLHKGWNMISARKSWSEINRNCTIKGPIYAWNALSRKYEKVGYYTKLEDYRGYWVYVNDSCFISEIEEEKNPRNWRDIDLIDIRTKKKFRISDFYGRPILLQSFAVWCYLCLDQQKEMRNLKNKRDDIAFISIDTDLGEDESIVRSHINKHAFDWYFAVSPPELTKSLMQEFGNVIGNVLSTPVVLVCNKTSARLLPTGLKRANELESEVAKGC